jgi:hypothetical protein
MSELSRILRLAVLLDLIGWVLIFGIVTCATPAHKHDSEFRWDQESLKAGDRGCPTAIYTAPNGELKQCP